MAKYGKRTTEARAAFAEKANVSVEDAVALIKGNSKAKFDETVEIAMNLGVDRDIETLIPNINEI